MRTYYHAGLSMIKDFRINYGGLHMGGRISALDVALRKSEELHKTIRDKSKIYLHHVILEDEGLLDTFDHGSAQHWELLAESFNKQGLSGALYYNEFEPDLRKSIFLCNPALIKGILKVEEFTINEAKTFFEELTESMELMYAA